MRIVRFLAHKVLMSLLILSRIAVECPQSTMRTSSAWDLTLAGLLDRPHARRELARSVKNSLVSGLDPETVRRAEELVGTRSRLRRGASLYRLGTASSALYAIHSGSFKTLLLDQDGHEQVAGYHLSGEVIGLDGIGSDVHECQAIALEDSEVHAMPFDRIEEVARDCQAFEHNVHRYLSREIARRRSLLVLLGTMRAEQRLATFLLELSQRYKALGYSSSELILRMTREEIGSYLGLKLETISRLLSNFQKKGIIRVQGRVVKILERSDLTRLVATVKGIATRFKTCEKQDAVFRARLQRRGGPPPLASSEPTRNYGERDQGGPRSKASGARRMTASLIGRRCQ